MLYAFICDLYPGHSKNSAYYGFLEATSFALMTLVSQHVNPSDL